MAQQIAALADVVSSIPDPQQRSGQRFPLRALLGLLILATLAGRGSLRGKLVWAQAHWEQIRRPLGFPRPSCPAYGTLWNLVAALDARALERSVGRWIETVIGHPFPVVAADGKYLRGSRRVADQLAALQQIEVAAGELGVVLAQQPVPDGDEVAGLVALLETFPLDGRLVTMDAGLIEADVLDAVVEAGGDVLAMVKNDHPSIKDALDTWVADQVGATRPVPVVSPADAALSAVFPPVQPTPTTGHPHRGEIPWSRGSAETLGGSRRPGRGVSRPGVRVALDPAGRVDSPHHEADPQRTMAGGGDDLAHDP